MTTIKFNDTTFEVMTYNKNTYFSGETITSNASCNIRVNDMATLNALAEEPITTIQIYYENNLIYNLQNTNAKIDNIGEYLGGDHMEINVNLTFDME